jgi:uncharacterized membrane protein YhfC
MPENLIVIMVVVVALETVMPLAPALWCYWKTDGSWRYFFYGMATFFIFQGILRIPVVSAAQMLLAGWIHKYTVVEASWMLILAVSAGFFEEGGRYVVLRHVLKPPHRWENGVMFGLGHGAMEVLLIGVGGLVGSLIVLNTPTENLPASVAAVKVQIETTPLYMPLVSGFERGPAIIAHVALTLLVLRALRDPAGPKRWLLTAIGAHSLLNFVTVGVMRVVNVFVAEGLLAIVGGFALWWLLRERRFSSKNLLT